MIQEVRLTFFNPIRLVLSRLTNLEGGAGRCVGLVKCNYMFPI